MIFVNLMAFIIIAHLAWWS